MNREIYSVNAYIVGSDGTYYNYTGYPKSYDSKLYDNDISKAKKRAIGEWHSVMSEFATRDDREIEGAYVVECSTGSVIRVAVFGKLAEVVPPNVEE